MAGIDFKNAGIFFLGLAAGLYVPSIVPNSLAFVQPYLGLVFIVIAVILLIKG